MYPESKFDIKSTLPLIQLSPHLPQREKYLKPESYRRLL